MSTNKNPLGLTDVILRDAHQSLLATRMRTEDMLPIAGKLDEVGFWSIESWGGATFDACIRYLGEDPWERIRRFKQAMPKTPQQMLFRGQNILGYRHYADDLVIKFVERAAESGVDVFRIFDAMNDMRNLETAICAVQKVGKHAQGTMSYTISPVYTIDSWLDMAKRIEEMGADSLCIKDMAGLLKPYVAFELISKLKETVELPIHMQCHATTGLSTATYLKAIEAGIDNVDTAISSMSMTYGHSATETFVSILDDTDRSTGLDIKLLEEIASYFRKIREKYAKFEGKLKGVDSRILVAQVPGGMLTNLENQLREQNASDRLDEVLAEIPRVRKDLGFIPLVTPTSQIVGTQAVLNILTGERYKSITRETEGVLKGEYGATPAPMDSELQKKVLGNSEPIECRPADLLSPEFETQRSDLLAIAKKEGVTLKNEIEDTLTYALFPQVGWKFIKNRNNPAAFEPLPTENNNPAKIPETSSSKPGVFTVEVGKQAYVVRVTEGGVISEPNVPLNSDEITQPKSTSGATSEVVAPLAGNVFTINVSVGQIINEGDTVLVLEAMKMETDIRASVSGTVSEISVQAGDAVKVGDVLLTLS
ncbi:MAG: oxaloacetate decarboxylase subunit alpha [Gammaproteobacteria bacterium]|nr:oxaloacetate decarboxylase subunit alpha [Gammaproteobacteria bacterium]